MIAERAHLLRAVLRAAEIAPSLRRGFGLTLLLALVGTSGQVVVPIAVQQLIDRHLGSGSTSVASVLTTGTIALLAVLVAVLCTRAAMLRLVRAAAHGLSELRVATFRHVHDLSVLHVQAERRGSLVARVTSDIEVITQFVEWGGVGLLVGTAQLSLVLVVMLAYDAVLAAIVAVAGLLYALLLLSFQRVLRRLYDDVRSRSASAVAAMSEAISGLPTIRAYGAESRTRERVDDALEAHRRIEVRSHVVGASMFSTAEVFAGALTAVVVGAGVLLVPGGLSAGRLIAFLFLVTLFIEPIQMLVEVLNEAQTAAAGIRRVLGVLDMPIDVADPQPGRSLPPGPLAVEARGVSYAYPRAPEDGGGHGPLILRDIDVVLRPGSRVAVVGETGSGKSTFVKLLCRLIDPTSGSIELGGVPLEQVAFASLRKRVISVPQEGFLFDATIADNVRYGQPAIPEAEIERAFDDLELGDWLESLPAGVATPVGERGSRLSTGERQLVALARAWVAGPDLLLLDEATSAVDPALEVRLRRAVERLTAGRTSVTVAHRLSTAEAADEVLVLDQGRLVQRGTHRDLVAEGGVYGRLHADWSAGIGGTTGGAEARS
ncbi:MAG: ABC transporter ATP-binding protein [Nitriliruptoraceae bacterium]